jgi:hypothetical protein
LIARLFVDAGGRRLRMMLLIITSARSNTPILNTIPSPVWLLMFEWENINRMKFFAGFVLGVASRMLKAGEISHKVISGLDWDADTVLKDTTFVDHPHFQLKPVT